MDQCSVHTLAILLGAYVALLFAQQHALAQTSESARHPLRLILFAAITTAPVFVCIGPITGNGM